MWHLASVLNIDLPQKHTHAFGFPVLRLGVLHGLAQQSSESFHRFVDVVFFNRADFSAPDFCTNGLMCKRCNKMRP